MCRECIWFLEDMIEMAEKDEPYTCKAKGILFGFYIKSFEFVMIISGCTVVSICYNLFPIGACDILPGTRYCQACFVRNCLLLLDLKTDAYFKMWRSVPPLARNYVPTKPPVTKRYPNRGKILLVHYQTGAILKTENYNRLEVEKVMDVFIKPEYKTKSGTKAESKGNLFDIKTRHLHLYICLEGSSSKIYLIYNSFVQLTETRVACKKVLDVVKPKCNTKSGASESKDIKQGIFLFYIKTRHLRFYICVEGSN